MVERPPKESDPDKECSVHGSTHVSCNEWTYAIQTPIRWVKDPQWTNTSDDYYFSEGHWGPYGYYSKENFSDQMMNATSEKIFIKSGDIILAYSNGLYNNLGIDNNGEIEPPLKKLHNRLQSIDAYDSTLIKEEIKTTAQEIFTLAYQDYNNWDEHHRYPRNPSPFDTTLVISVVY